MTILTFESHANYCILYATVNNTDEDATEMKDGD